MLTHWHVTYLTVTTKNGHLDNFHGKLWIILLLTSPHNTDISSSVVVAEDQGAVERVCHSPILSNIFGILQNFEPKMVPQPSEAKATIIAQTSVCFSRPKKWRPFPSKNEPISSSPLQISGEKSDAETSLRNCTSFERRLIPWPVKKWTQIASETSLSRDHNFSQFLCHQECRQNEPKIQRQLTPWPVKTDPNYLNWTHFQL